MAINLFYNNIRQNCKLRHGIMECIPLQCTSVSVCVQFFSLLWPSDTI